MNAASTPSPALPPALQAHVAAVLEEREIAFDWDDPARVAPIANAFQEKHTVIELQPYVPPFLVLKFETTDGPSTLVGEGHILRFLATTGVPVPRLIDRGTLPGQPGSKEGVSYLLMERLSGIPLNWLYYTAAPPERRHYLRQVLELIADLAALRVSPQQGASALGSIAGEISQSEKGIMCPALGPSGTAGLAPSTSVADYFNGHIAYWLDRLKAVDSARARELTAVWRRLDEALLAEEPICLAHADIAPMNIIVDPETRHITGLVDWEFAGFHPLDTDYHALLYFDRHQEWKWCGPGDIDLVRDLMGEMGIEPPAGYEERLLWFDVLQLARDLTEYRNWFAQAPDEEALYEAALERRLKSCLST